MTSYLGDSEYRPTPQHANFALPSHFDMRESQCYEARPRGRNKGFSAAIHPATGRSMFETTSRAYDLAKAEREDILLPVRQTSELNFHGYFVDTCGLSHTIRRCNVTYFVEDGSLRVVEPKTQNSGFDQGEYLKRSFVQNPETNRAFRLEDFVIGKSVNICGTEIQITDADALTRQYVKLGPAAPIPQSKNLWPYNSPVSVVDGAGRGNHNTRYHGRSAPISSAMHGQNTPKRFLQFLTHDRQVLRFYGVWHPDATDSRADRNVVVLFYLADGTLQIQEGESREEELTKRVLARQRVVKGGSRYNCINQPTDAQYFGPADFECGSDVVIFGKRVSLNATDQYTHSWYQQFHPHLRQVLPQAHNAPVSSRPAPAEHFNGYGPSIDESFSRTDDDDATDDAIVLKFHAKLYLPRHESRTAIGAATTLYDMADADRRFVISFYPNDSSCMVSELQNEVYPGGVFLKKARYRFHETGSSSNVARRFRSTDFGQGAVVSFEFEPVSASMAPEKNIPAGPASAKFVLGSADEFTMTYLNKEAEMREHRVQTTLDRLRYHFSTEGMSPAWVRGQLRWLGRAQVTPKEMRRALDFFAVSIHNFSHAALDFIFAEFGKLDQTSGPMLVCDDLVDELVRRKTSQEIQPTAANPEALLKALQGIRGLRAKFRSYDVEKSGLISVPDVHVVLRQAGVVAPTAAVVLAMQPFVPRGRETRPSTDLKVDYNSFCDACASSTWAPLLPGNNPIATAAAPPAAIPQVSSSTAPGHNDFHGPNGELAPPQSIAAIAGMGRYPHARDQTPPEHHFYQDLSRRTEDPFTVSMRNRMLGSSGVSAAFAASPK